MLASPDDNNGVREHCDRTANRLCMRRKCRVSASKAKEVRNEVNEADPRKEASRQSCQRQYRGISVTKRMWQNCLRAIPYEGVPWNSNGLMIIYISVHWRNPAKTGLIVLGPVQTHRKRLTLA